MFAVLYSDLPAYEDTAEEYNSPYAYTVIVDRDYDCSGTNETTIQKLDSYCRSEFQQDRSTKHVQRSITVTTTSNHIRKYTMTFRCRDKTTFRNIRGMQKIMDPVIPGGSKSVKDTDFLYYCTSRYPAKLPTFR